MSTVFVSFTVTKPSEMFIFAVSQSQQNVNSSKNSAYLLSPRPLSRYCFRLLRE